MANIAYNEFIQDKEHQHMNSTMWTTLTDFVKYLGKEGKCVVDETDKGWFIQWIDRNPQSVARGGHVVHPHAPYAGARGEGTRDSRGAIAPAFGDRAYRVA